VVAEQAPAAPIRPPGYTIFMIEVARSLSDAVSKLAFAEPVTHVYNPLAYAGAVHEAYLARYARRPEALFLGMNPGPWGMAQTGVPFGEVGLVRDWLGLEGAVGKPDPEHPARPIEGFACRRSEVSGARLWGWARSRHGTPDAFFDRFFVWNYCPLVFMEASGRNRTPDKLPAAERAALEGACDAALRALVAVLRPRLIIGVGAFAEGRARAACPGVTVGRIPHPSPASPAANRGWEPLADAAMAALGFGP
jgi:single-strand selective monofunctional uracil DNA glycosylase